MKCRMLLYLTLLSVLACPAGWGASDAGGAGAVAPAGTPDLEEILERMEARYAVEGFEARFHQTSVIEAMDITDTASGRIFIKRPGKMRWEYEKPEPQVIVSDGVELWIYRPEDNQVIVGRAPDFFGNGRGAGFLTDIRNLREHFEVTLEARGDSDNHWLKLVPRNHTPDFSYAYLSVSWATFEIEEIVSFNAYGDETRITLSDAVYDRRIADELFRFTAPEGVEVLEMQ